MKISELRSHIASRHGNLKRPLPPLAAQVMQVSPLCTSDSMEDAYEMEVISKLTVSVTNYIARDMDFDAAKHETNNIVMDVIFEEVLETLDKLYGAQLSYDAMQLIVELQKKIKGLV